MQASSTLGRVYAALGRRDEALKIIGRMDANADPQGVAHMHFALGDHEKGFSRLSKSIDRGRDSFAGLTSRLTSTGCGPIRGLLHSLPVSNFQTRRPGADALPSCCDLGPLGY